jgi:hypothetical protein
MSGRLGGISAAQELSVLRRHRSHRWHFRRHSRTVPFRVPEHPFIFQQVGLRRHQCSGCRRSRLFCPVLICKARRINARKYCFPVHRVAQVSVARLRGDWRPSRVAVLSADDAYSNGSCDCRIITPYSGRLTQMEDLFNFLWSPLRIVVEQVCGVIFARWGIL